jgi:hypothetical protein
MSKAASGFITPALALAFGVGAQAAEEPARFCATARPWPI